MKRTCPDCHQEYDGLISNTYCPHTKFEMHTLVTRGTEEGCAHTPEQLKAFVAGELPLPNRDCDDQARPRNSLRRSYRNSAGA